MSPKQTRILEAITRGSSYKECAAGLGISANTIKTHMKLILARTGARSSREAAWRLRNP